MNPYADLGLRPVINAAGAMTYLGASVLDPDVAATVAAATRHFVALSELQREVGRRLAEASGAEAGLAVGCAAAGIATGVAACITGDDEGAVGLLPDWPHERRAVVLMKAHAVSFGAPVTQMVQLTGGRPWEVGQVNRFSEADLVRCLADPATAAALYVVSHHAGGEGAPALPRFVELAHAQSVPVLVDAAAEVDLRAYIALGADLVVYSGHKAVRGPTSGILVGRADLVRAAAMHQNLGVGRAMKIGKEQMAGLAKAVERYTARDVAADQAAWEATVAALESRLGASYTTVRSGEPHRGIVRLTLVGTPAWARELVKALEAGSPAIHTRNHEVGQGRVTLDPRFLEPEDVGEVCARLLALAPTLAAGMKPQHAP
jgi:D-glucosaminate-6-phosphate ammonia-lyase